MQSSESQGWPMNTIKNPKDSIYYGVKHLKGAFDDAKKNGITDLSAIVQSYNFGRAYLRWLASNNKQHSLPVADLYSKTVVAPSLGNTTGAMVQYSTRLLWPTMVVTDIRMEGISSTLKLLSNM